MYIELKDCLINWTNINTTLFALTNFNVSQKSKITIDTETLFLEQLNGKTYFINESVAARLE